MLPCIACPQPYRPHSRMRLQTVARRQGNKCLLAHAIPARIAPSKQRGTKAPAQHPHKIYVHTWPGPVRASPAPNKYNQVSSRRASLSRRPCPPSQNQGGNAATAQNNRPQKKKKTRPRIHRLVVHDSAGAVLSHAGTTPIAPDTNNNHISLDVPIGKAEKKIANKQQTSHTGHIHHPGSLPQKQNKTKTAKRQSPSLLLHSFPQPVGHISTHSLLLLPHTRPRAQITTDRQQQQQQQCRTSFFLMVDFVA